MFNPFPAPVFLPPCGACGIFCSAGNNGTQRKFITGEFTGRRTMSPIKATLGVVIVAVAAAVLFWAAWPDGDSDQAAPHAIDQTQSD